MKGKRISKKGVEKLDESQTLAQKISTKLRALREAAGYTSHETFAYDHGFDRTQWGNMERGIDMKTSSLERALQAFDITPAEFFKDIS